MLGGIEDLDHLVFDKRSIDKYIDLVLSYYELNKVTTEVHIDTLVLLYKITGDDKVFNVLFKVHLGLLIKITKNIYQKYYKFLYYEDYYDMMAMVFGEFYRRTLYYKIPPIAPFSKYIKSYIMKWLNTYTKIIVKKNNRYVLECDREVEIDKLTY